MELQSKAFVLLIQLQLTKEKPIGALLWIREKTVIAAPLRRRI